MNRKFKFVLIISLLLVGSMYMFMFITFMRATIYYREFKADTFNKIEIEIKNNYTDKKVGVTISDEDQIEYFCDMFVKNLEYGEKKERKLYDYSILFKFYNLSLTNVYIYKLYFDDEKVSFRPVGLAEEGKSSVINAFPFILKDSDYEFYTKMLQILEPIKINFTK